MLAYSRCFAMPTHCVCSCACAHAPSACVAPVCPPSVKAARGVGDICCNVLFAGAAHADTSAAVCPSRLSHNSRLGALVAYLLPTASRVHLYGTDFAACKACLMHRHPTPDPCVIGCACTCAARCSSHPDLPTPCDSCTTVWTNCRPPRALFCAFH